MTALQIILAILVIIVSVIIVVLVALQESKQQGLSGAIAGGAETFLGKSKSKTIEQKLVKITKILAIVFFVLSLVSTPFYLYC